MPSGAGASGRRLAGPAPPVLGRVSRATAIPAHLRDAAPVAVCLLWCGARPPCSHGRRQTRAPLEAPIARHRRLQPCGGPRSKSRTRGSCGHAARSWRAAARAFAVVATAVFGAGTSAGSTWRSRRSCAPRLRPRRPRADDGRARYLSPVGGTAARRSRAPSDGVPPAFTWRMRTTPGLTIYSLIRRRADSAPCSERGGSTTADLMKRCSSRP